jgi:hypothetical protein
MQSNDHKIEIKARIDKSFANIEKTNDFAFYPNSEIGTGSARGACRFGRPAQTFV